MAKKKKDKDVDAQPSIGEQMKSTGNSQRDRNLALKAKLIEDGKHPEPKFKVTDGGMTQREKNLALKANLNGDKGE